MKVAQQDDNDAVTLLMDLRVYSIDAVLSAAYLFTDVCYIKVDTVDGDKALVQLSAKTPDTVVEQIAKNFQNEVIDQQLRLRLRRETEEIRRMIIAEAFAPLEAIPNEE